MQQLGRALTTNRAARGASGCLFRVPSIWLQAAGVMTWMASATDSPPAWGT